MYEHQESEKLVYLRPELKIYGAVSQLTRAAGKSSLTADNAGNQGMDKTQ